MAGTYFDAAAAQGACERGGLHAGVSSSFGRQGLGFSWLSTCVRLLPVDQEIVQLLAGSKLRLEPPRRLPPTGPALGAVFGVPILGKNRRVRAARTRDSRGTVSRFNLAQPFLQLG